MNSEFFDHLRRFPTNPYLFVGSGLSRRYLELPTWENLLLEFFERSGIKGDIEYFQSKCNGNLPMLASLLASEFHEIWWKNAKYKDSRSAYKHFAREGVDLPFKIETSEILLALQKEGKEYNDEIRLFRQCVIDGIITTNWDQFLEKNFVDYKVYIGQQELLFSESISIGEIYKIHGCVSRPQSIVVTEEDYEDFNDKNAYLAAKLLTIFVEHPIVFLGYSLSDSNVLQIIDAIVKCVDGKNLDKLKDRLIFIEWESGAHFEMKDSSLMLAGSRVLPIKLIKTDSFIPVFETMCALNRRIPVKILRKLKSSIVEFVKTNQPTSKVYVKDIESIDDQTSIEYAIGVGVASQLLSVQGYTAIDTIDLIEDVLNDNKNYDAITLIENTLPRLLKGNGFVPVYKYLRASSLLTKSGVLTGNAMVKYKGKFNLRLNPPTCFMPSAQYFKKQGEMKRNHKDISSIITSYDKQHALNYIPLIDIRSTDMSVLLRFLRNCFLDEKIRRDTSFRKLVCLYDYFNFGIEK